MGWAREMSSMPVLDRIRALTETGRWGLVTNWASIEVLGECRNKNRIVEARMWCGKVSGSENSSAVLTFDWVSKGDHGIEERIAIGRMGFTWVEIYGHGLVRPAPFPDYYQEFIGSMVAQNDAPDRFIQTAEPYRTLEIGEAIYAPKIGPTGGIPLGEKVFDTYLFDANLVGNLYFGNYSIWMGKLRDATFFQMAPEFYRGVGELGELTCVSSRIQHLREAMPFDDIVVTMSLKAVHKKGLDLMFEFQKKMEGGKGEKLAIGEHRVIWTKADAKGERVATDLPEKILSQIMALVHKHTFSEAG
jgi:enediyne polyketide synthase